MNNNKTEIIAFFSAEGFFRIKNEAAQWKKFEALKPEFEKEFSDDIFLLDEDDLKVYYDNLFNFLVQYQAEQAAARKERQKKREIKRASLPIASGLDNISDHIKTLPAGRYVLTCAQNNTHVNDTALNCLITYCQHNEAKLLIARITYNKTGFCQPDIDNDLWYDPKVKPYLVNGHIDLQGVQFLVDSNVIPTAKNPLSGFDSATNAGIHAIIPHTTIALSVVAALKNSPTKTLASTGTVTKSNYIMRKAGAVAALNHCLGGLLVDTTDPDNVIIRQLQLMPGCDYIYDLNHKYNMTGERLEVHEHIAALQPGDIHAEKMSVENLQTIINLLNVFSPKHLILHDLLDFSSRNHHNVKDCTFIHEQSINNRTVKDDLQSMTGIIDKLATYCKNIVVIESNHDLALMTWLKNEDFKKDPINAIVYLQCMLALYKHQAEFKNSDFNMLEYAYGEICGGENYCGYNIKFNRVDESLIIANTEMGCHGHNGANGSKGSPVQFRKLGIALNTGHTHSPSIHGKVYTAGVSASLELGYNLGASSWAIAHILTYENGQRQILFT